MNKTNWRERFNKQMFVSMQLEKGEIKGFNMDELYAFIEQEIIKGKIEVLEKMKELGDYTYQNTPCWELQYSSLEDEVDTLKQQLSK